MSHYGPERVHFGHFGAFWVQFGPISGSEMFFSNQIVFLNQYVFQSNRAGLADKQFESKYNFGKLKQTTKNYRIVRQLLIDLLMICEGWNLQLLMTLSAKTLNFEISVNMDFC